MRKTMKRYITFITTLCAVLCGVGAGIASSYFCAPLRSVLIGAVVGTLMFFAIPAHFYGQDRFFDKAAGEYKELYLNESVLVLTHKKTYKGRLCVSDNAVVLLFRFKGRAVPLVFHRKDSPTVTFNAQEKTLSIRSEMTDRGAFLASGMMLSNIESIYRTLKEKKW